MEDLVGNNLALQKLYLNKRITEQPRHPGIVHLKYSLL
jgi:hypothetical protein